MSETPQIDASPDLFVFDIGADAFENATKWTSGNLTNEFTPSQAQDFAEFVQEEIANE